MSDKIRLTETVLINGEVAKPGVYQRDQFTDSQVEWLTTQRLAVEAVEQTEPSNQTNPTDLPPRTRKRKNDDTTQAL